MPLMFGVHHQQKRRDKFNGSDVLLVRTWAKRRVGVAFEASDFNDAAFLRHALLAVNANRHRVVGVRRHGVKVQQPREYFRRFKVRVSLLRRTIARGTHGGDATLHTASVAA